MTVRFSVEHAERADLAIGRKYPDAGRRRIAALFEDGHVAIVAANGTRRSAKKGDRVAPGDAIELAEEPASGEALRPIPDDDAAAQLVTLVERADLVAVAKPAGMPSQPLRAGERGTAANGIVARWPECRDVTDPAAGEDPRDGGLVHRLDVGTSGVLVAARSLEAHRALRAAFATGRVEKQYLAITCGRPTAKTIDAPLAQRGKHVVVDATEGLHAQTAFAVERESATHALVRCTARTGRMHQVRAHLALAGAPIAGDTLYGGAELPGHPGFFLHAARVALLDLVIEAPLPERFVAALAAVSL